VQPSSIDLAAAHRSADTARLLRVGRLLADWPQLAAALMLLAADWLAVAGCLLLAWLLRAAPLRLFIHDMGGVDHFGTFLRGLFYLLPWLVAFAEVGLYTRRWSFWEEVRATTRGCTLAALIAVLLSFTVRPTGELSRAVIGMTWLFTLVAVPAVRASLKPWLVRIGWFRKRVLILGAGELGREVCTRLRRETMFGYQPAGFVDDDASLHGASVLDLPVCGPLSASAQVVRQVGAKDIIIALPGLPREQLLALIGSCEGTVQSIRVVSDVTGLATVGVEAEEVDGLVLLHMRQNLVKPWNLLLKRCLDLLGAGLGIVVLSPLWLLGAMAVRLDSRGGVLFEQERLGRGGQRFRCLKLRTMFLDNEKRLNEYLRDDGAAHREWQQFLKLRAHDPRITRVGRHLRRWSIDELPQLWNVLRGDMSLVGPRPYLPAESERMAHSVEKVLRARPGMTGLWQVSGRNDLTFEQRVGLDEYYVRNWSLWMDVVIVLKTLGAVVRRHGAY
jgi:undecaprenyl-phosphate galactose phosphotransferase